MAQSVELTQKYWRENLERRQSLGDVIAQTQRVNFWEHPTAMGMYRDLYRPAAEPRDVRAGHLLLKDAKSPIFKRAVSFGSGAGQKEMAMVKRGQVEHFTLVEIVPELMLEARQLAERMGISDRVETVSAGYQDFSQQNQGSYDLVYWDNALHHMSDTDEAIAKTSEVLVDGGVFLMDDFVGPTYNQFPESVYRLADAIRATMPPNWFEGERKIPLTLGRIPVQAYLDTDPSEATDSGNILPSIAKRLLGASVIPMGGLYYYLALRGAYGQFEDDNPAHVSLLSLLFHNERVMRAVKPDLSMYALAYWRKGDVTVGKRPSDWRELIPQKYKTITS